MYPLGFNGIEPGTLGRKTTHQQSTASFTLDTTIVGFYPGLHFLADVPTGVVPDHHQHSLAFLRQGSKYPGKKRGRDMADGATRHKAQTHLIRIGAKQSIASKGFGVGILGIRFLLEEAQRLVCGPSVQVGLGKTAKPDFILEAQNPIRVEGAVIDQALSPVFLSAYCESGLLIHCLARRKLPPSRLSACRIVS
jgi:hypothetical protein